MSADFPARLSQLLNIWAAGFAAGARYHLQPASDDYEFAGSTIIRVPSPGFYFRTVEAAREFARRHGMRQATDAEMPKDE